ncbi:hypothetical protein M3P21_17215 [Ruegeria sp. 2012CJ41-6]|uniref:Glycosyltransferase RgtA/B/C/D-like domain-containing protein n=1 Tax=Ruegeria spongiae TaxID=2942209 RepID=A0ABT0Q5X2_9RHOB|nr:hypothetical protein [Ruegeria spongiae]MCL6285271.1 hypothetical protein [Ruegeria spongiae]
MSGRFRNFAPLAAIVFFALLQCIPAALNGFPFVFFDTHGYYDAGEAVTGVVVKSERADPLSNDAPSNISVTTTEAGDPPDENAGNDGGKKLIQMSRSPYYGVILFNLWQVSPFLIVLFQSLIIALVVWLVCREVCPKRPVSAFLAAGVVCAALTPLPYFTSYSMPDVFSGLIPLIIFLLCYRTGTLSRSAFVFLWGLLVAVILFHSSHILVSLGLILFVTLLAVSRKYRPRISGWIGVTSAFATGILGVFLFAFVAYTVFGSWPVNPPFLTARGIEDGPVARMIEQGCDPDEFAICAARPLPNTDSTLFLWQGDSFYQQADPEMKTRLAREDAAVFLTAAGKWPGLQFTASARNFLTQIRKFGLFEFKTAKRVFREAAPSFMTQSELAAYGDSRAVSGRYPFEALSIVVYLSALAGLAMVLYLVSRADTDRSLRILVVLVLVTMVGNALVTGVLSDPHHRYQARIIWLLPLLATLLVFRTGATGRKPG